MLTNHTDNPQQKSIPNSHKHAHMSLPNNSLVPVRRAEHCKQKNQKRQHPEELQGYSAEQSYANCRDEHGVCQPNPDMC